MRRRIEKGVLAAVALLLVLDVLAVGLTRGPSGADGAAASESGGAGVPVNAEGSTFTLPSANCDRRPLAVTYTVLVDASVNCGRLPRYEQMQSKIQRVKGAADLAHLRALGTKYERIFQRPCVYNKNGEGVYDWNTTHRFNLQDATINEMIAQGTVPIVASECVPPWNASGTNPDHPENVPPLNWDKYVTTLKDGYVHMKQKYPAIEYVESYNEPDLNANHFNEATRLRFYDAFSTAVRAANAQLGLPKPGNPTLKLGGPVYKMTDVAQMTRFLQHVKEHGDMLEFISWHMYNVGASKPTAYRDEVESIRQVAQSEGFGDLPLMITEWGLTAAADRVAPSKEVLARDAAAAVAINYFFMQARIDYSFKFAQSDYNGFSRSLLVPMPVGSDPVIDSRDGKVFPSYNAYLMMAKMKTDRIGVTASLDNNGLGVGAIAAMDPDAVSVLIWNYNGASSTVARPVTVGLANLPAALQGQSLTVERYLVDATHSNYAYDPNKDDLERMPDISLSASQRSIDLGTVAGNSVTLLIIRR